MTTISYRSIALLGTSADPPTNGHQALLIGLCKLFPKVLTWASNNPGKKHEHSLNQRIELLNALVEKLSLPNLELKQSCLLYTSPSPRDVEESRMPSSA